jgi:hypothetical protein
MSIKVCTMGEKKYKAKLSQRPRVDKANGSSTCGRGGGKISYSMVVKRVITKRRRDKQNKMSISFNLIVR